MISFNLGQNSSEAREVKSVVLPQHQTYLGSEIEKAGIKLLQSQEEGTAEILHLEQETEGLLNRLVNLGDSVKI